MKYVRVKQAGTGHELSVPEEHYLAVAEGSYELLDKPAVDEGGVMLPPKPRTTVDREAAKNAADDSAPPYSRRKKGDLEDEVESRNADRDPDGEDYIVVGGNGTIADLAAALDADDENQEAAAAADTDEAGQQADPSEGDS